MFRGTTFRYLGGATLTLATLMAAAQWTRSRADVGLEAHDPRPEARDRAVPGTTTAVSTIGQRVDDDGVLIDRSAIFRSRGGQS